MIRQIRLQNFMSHIDTVLDLADGLTVLIGPNNCGKSAVVEALRAVCENVPASYMIKHGEKEARVTLLTDDGHTVVWIRTKTSTAYEIDGIIHTRLQGKIPDELHKILRMPPVDVEGNEEVDVHIAHQKAPIFLLNAPGSRPAAFFASSSDAGRLIEMQELHRARKREREQEKRRIDREIADLDETLNALRPLPDIQEQAKQADALSEGIEQGLRRAEQLSRLMGDVTTAEGARSACASRATPLTALKPPPELHDTEALNSFIRQLQAASDLVDACQRRVKVMFNLSQPPHLFDTAALEQTINGLTLAAASQVVCRRNAETLSQLTEPPELGDVISLEQTINGLTLAAASQVVCRRNAEALSQLTEPPELGDVISLERSIVDIKCTERRLGAYTLASELLGKLLSTPILVETGGLRETITGIEKAKAATKGAKDNVRDIKIELGSVKELIEALVASNPTCPTCGAEVTADTLLRSHKHV